MQKTILLILMLLLAACSKNSEFAKYNAETHLSEDKKIEFLSEIIRYIGSLPAKATHETKFLNEFDDHYGKLITKYSLDYYYPDLVTGHIYFMTSFDAPSLYGKRTAAAGIISFNDDRSINYYEEKFRTWKMMPDELEDKSKVLFAKMIAGEDLTPYYPENSGDEEYIEFPNQHTFFDSEQRRWITTLFDPSEEFRNSKY